MSTTATDDIRFRRWTGDPADKDIFNLRFHAAANQLDYADVYDGTINYADVPNDSATVNAMTALTPADRAEKKNLLLENKAHQKHCTRAYHFVIDSLDAQTALTVQNEAPDEHDARAAYDAAQRILNDQGIITQMNLTMELLQIRCEDGSDPLQCRPCAHSRNWLQNWQPLDVSCLSPF
jgi:hypothetical protein